MKFIFITLTFCLTMQTNYVYSSGDHHDHSHGHSHDQKTMAHKPKRKDLSSQELKEIHTVFELNEKLHQSFFNYDAKMVQKNAKLVVEAISKISNDPIRNMLMMSKPKLEKIKATSKREDNNKFYAFFSSHLVHILKMYNISKDYDEYYCSMADKQWIQNSKKTHSKVKNPYMPTMKGCGTKKG
ncbi:MAG: DUF3347 domain-containing protein [Bacteriovoracaceae bacterium]|nr:DUF3347 domain-containing protein [Bacteriovoracaceae bacterium]